MTLASDIPAQEKGVSRPFGHVAGHRSPGPPAEAGSPAEVTQPTVPSSRLPAADPIADLPAGVVPAVLIGQARRVTEEITPLYRQALSGRVEVPAGSRTRLRSAGQAWSGTGLSLEELLTCFSALTSGVADAVLTQAQPARQSISSILDLTNQLTREFVIGIGHTRPGEPPRHAHHRPRNPAADLLAGRPPTGGAGLHLAARYLVVVVRHTPDRAGAPAVRTMRAVGGEDTFVLPGGTETIALIPARDRGDSRRLGEDLDRYLGGRIWITVAERDRAAIPDGYREATGILDLVCATRREPGVYRLDDVLLEYAALRDHEASSTLSAVLEPLVSNAVLYETLATLVRADFNRNTTAKNLFIHRSTLDYRIDRIRELTGHDPLSIAGAQLFGIAIALHATKTMNAHQRAT